MTIDSSNSAAKKYLTSVPGGSKQVNLSMFYNTKVEAKSLVLIVSAKDHQGDDITDSCDQLQYSEKLGRSFVYAPAADGPSLVHAKNMIFTSGVHTMEIIPISWPSSEPVLSGPIENILFSWPSRDIKGWGSEPRFVVCASSRGIRYENG